MRLTDPLVWTIRGYQRLISRFMPPTCRFYPSCSRYTVTALTTHGILRGGALAAWRILRCNPFFEGGLDPVPGLAGAASGGDGAHTHGGPDGPCPGGHHS